MIKTSKENREIVARLSRKLGLGSENHISRIAFSYSINSDKKLNVSKIKNSSGKVYSKSVFFGNNFNLICNHKSRIEPDTKLANQVF